MDFLADFLLRLLAQFQSPTLGFLIGGMLLVACGSKLTIPDAIYKFIVFMLLMKIGLKGGMEIRDANLAEMFLPAVITIVIGVVIVLLGILFFSFISSIKKEDGYATAGLFGAVSASTFAAAMVLLEEEAIAYEAWVPALYPFMDIPALVLAIVLANVYMKKQQQGNTTEVNVWGIIKESLQGSALSALILGLALGLFTTPDKVFGSFYEPLFRGFLSILMLIMGMEAYARIHELKRVAQWYAVYAFFAPIIHGLLAFGLGTLAHYWVGFSPGGVVLLAVMAASSSDISGPPTLRSGIPSANPSAYIGASTSVGTPVAIAVCIPLFIVMAQTIFEV
ncbi:sodium-dependent bicarbonate transport family permease [Marinicella sp. S1101]|uniref:sodium-dependent bicarbonate transport family permease n=1 Tax=Marinicella marina TaxID=2996016 RepID=UPI002260AA49|nr:sodium-dependent bicarbonate transport family permease [Marinicella marina]MCX7554419.1 sodium-dependent bicarbonate transport family permease [Marinicella marina]MDJ1140570.1 sodium-dependent bicarbonate transport family permease [Marinicella marina]